MELHQLLRFNCFSVAHYLLFESIIFFLYKFKKKLQRSIDFTEWFDMPHSRTKHINRIDFRFIHDFVVVLPSSLPPLPWSLAHHDGDNLTMMPQKLSSLLLHSWFYLYVYRLPLFIECHWTTCNSIAISLTFNTVRISLVTERVQAFFLYVHISIFYFLSMTIYRHVMLHAEQSRAQV